MATVYRNGHSRHVANLGWLLRNWKTVESIIISPLYADESSYDCRMVVKCKNDVTYTTRWASSDLCWKWLQRSIFIGCPLTWFGIETKVTKGSTRPDGQLVTVELCVY